MTGLIQTIGQAVVLFAFSASVLFMIGYTLLAPWWKTSIGWARISLDFGIAVALSPTVIHVLLDTKVENSLVFAWYTIGAIAFVGLVALWNLALVARLQLQGHIKGHERQRRNGGDTPDRDVRPS